MSSVLDETINGFLAEVDGGILTNQIFVNAPLSDLSTYRVGGPAALLIKVEDDSSFSTILRGLAKFPMPVMVMGNGSNVLISDRGFEGICSKVGGIF